MGIAGKHILGAFGQYQDIKVRLARVFTTRSRESVIHLTQVCWRRISG